MNIDIVGLISTISGIVSYLVSLFFASMSSSLFLVFVVLIDVQLRVFSFFMVLVLLLFFTLLSGCPRICNIHFQLI